LIVASFKILNLLGEKYSEQMLSEVIKGLQQATEKRIKKVTGDKVE